MFLSFSPKGKPWRTAFVLMLVPLLHSRVSWFALKLLLTSTVPSSSGQNVSRAIRPSLPSPLAVLMIAQPAPVPALVADSIFHSLSEVQPPDLDAIQVMGLTLQYFFLVISCFSKPPISPLTQHVPQGAHGHPSPRRPPKSFAQSLISPSVPILGKPQSLRCFYFYFSLLKDNLSFFFFYHVNPRVYTPIGIVLRAPPCNMCKFI